MVVSKSARAHCLLDGTWASSEVQLTMGIEFGSAFDRKKNATTPLLLDRCEPPPDEDGRTAMMDLCTCLSDPGAACDDAPPPPNCLCWHDRGEGG